jgi:hypothetical protein
MRTVPFDPNVTKVMETIQELINDTDNFPYLIKYLHSIIDVNLPYTFSDLRMIDSKHCSSNTFLYYIFNIILHIYKSYSATIVTKTYTKSFPMKDYIVDPDTDNLLTQIYILTSYAYTVCYSPQLRIHLYNIFQLADLNKLIEEYQLIGNSPQITNLKNKIEIIQKNNNFGKIVLDDIDYINKIDGFIDSMIDEKEFPVNNDFIDSFIQTYNSKFNIDRSVVINDKIINFFVKLIGNSKIPPFIRYACAQLIIIMTDDYGYRNRHTDLLYNFMTYIAEVNAFILVHPEIAHKHYKSVLILLSGISISLKRSEFKDIDFTKGNDCIFKGIHKISSKAMEFTDYLINHCKELSSRPKITTQKHRIKTSNLPVINIHLVSVINCYTTINDIIKNIIKDIDQLSNVLIMPVVSMIISSLNFLCDGKNPIYSIYDRNMETLEILKKTFEIMNQIKNNKNFKKEIYDYIPKVNEMLSRVKMTKDAHDELISYFKNFTIDDHIDVKDLPEEFTDPLLCTQIKDPFMIPNVDLIFDKSSIMSQLYHEKINPYTREVLTIEQVELYNKESRVINIISGWKVETKINNILSKYSKPCQ